MLEGTWTESEHYAWLSNMGQVDPARQSVSVFREIDGHQSRGHKPLVSWEMQRHWIARFGLSPVLGYELDDPC